MIPVANQPILAHVLAAVAEAGITEVILVVGYQRDRIQSYVGDGGEWGLDVSYAIQEHQHGTGHAVQQVKSVVDDEFLVMNGDRIIDAELVAQVRDTMDGSAAASVSVTWVEQPRGYGITLIEDDTLIRIDEKPVGEPPTAMINAGVYRFCPSIFGAIDAVPRTPDGELQLTSAITQLAADATVEVVRYRGRWLDVSYPWDLLRVNDELLVGETPQQEGDIDATAVVTDRTSIGQGTMIGANATINRGTVVGPNVTIGANAVVSNVVVMADATIGPGAVVRDGIIDENATIGPNATITGGKGTVVIDDTVHHDIQLGGVIGANAQIGGGSVVAPGSIIGADVTAGPGCVIDGCIDDGVTVRGG